MTKYWKTCSCIAVFCATLCLLPSGSAQRQGEDCRALVANHTYAIYFGGFLNVPLFYLVEGDLGWGDVPNAGLGKITFKTNGEVVNQQTNAIGRIGLLKDAALSGTYALAWDLSRGAPVCTGTMTEENGYYNFLLLVSENGRRIDLTRTTTGQAVNPTGFLMPDGGCTNASLRGGYTYNTVGWGMLPTPVPANQTLGGFVPATMTGVMTFRPREAPTGTFANTPPPRSAAISAWDTVSINGQIVPRIMNGWYKINYDCSGTIVLNDGVYPEYVIEAYIGRDGDKAALLNVNAVNLGDGPVPVYLMPILLNRTASDWR